MDTSKIISRMLVELLLRSPYKCTSKEPFETPKTFFSSFVNLITSGGIEKAREDHQKP
jgi:hypothetical protein